MKKSVLARDIPIFLALVTFFATTGWASSMPSSVPEVASAALVTLATTGNPDPLQAELGGTVISSAELQEKVGSLLNLEKEEHLAPKALVTPKGETYAMVAPTLTQDNYIFVDSQGNMMRMDVGDTEGHHKPFVVQKIIDLPPSVSGVASAALVTLATTGNPDPLQAELGGEIISSAELQENVGNLLNLEKKEHLAPKALVTPEGETYSMVAPTITQDNFIFVDSQGNAVRMDVGETEGHHKPFVVLNIVEDGGTPWYVEFWRWITFQ